MRIRIEQRLIEVNGDHQDVEPGERVVVEDVRDDGLRYTALNVLGWELQPGGCDEEKHWKRCRRTWTRADTAASRVAVGCECSHTPSEERVAQMLGPVSARLLAYREALRQAPPEDLTEMMRGALHLDATPLCLMRVRPGTVMQLAGNGALRQEELRVLAQRLSVLADSVIPHGTVVVVGDTSITQWGVDELENVLAAARAKMRGADAPTLRDTEARGFAGGGNEVVKPGSEWTGLTTDDLRDDDADSDNQMRQDP